MADSFPRQKARTRNYTLGTPRDFRVGADGARVVFLRAPAGDDPQTALWAFDVADGRERLVCDPPGLLGEVAEESLSAEERVRRERKRETARGIVAYATDANARVATFTLAGTVFVADLAGGGVRALEDAAPAADPRPDPTGTRVAFVHGRALHVTDVAGGPIRRLAGDPDPSVTWGLADFIAAEEIERDRGFWWSPDGSTLLATRVDEGPVERTWITSAAHPKAPPTELRYPFAGRPNATTGLHLVPVNGDAPVEVRWDREEYPYLVTAHWDSHGPLAVVQTRDQRRIAVLAIDPAGGATSPLHEHHDEAWVDIVRGVPFRLSDGSLVVADHVEDSLALIVGGRPVTAPGVELRMVLGVTGDEIWFSAVTDPVEVHVWRWSAETGATQVTSEPGVHTAAVGGGLCVIGSSGLDHDGPRWRTQDHVFESRAQEPVLTPEVRLQAVGERGLRAGLVLPRDHSGGTALPVLVDPYGGPARQRVVAARQAWREPQWWADQGFAVVVVDGRGTPGRGREWSRAIRGDLAGPVLDDQVDALRELVASHPELDASRVAIRGWSFGGYLAALAVLRRPDVFHAAVAGAPVTDWRLYDTHYTERYLGTDPDGRDADAYARSSLLEDAQRLERPLMLIHGLEDDNVLAAHTLQLSRRLLDAGRPHEVLPLSGVTHMTPDERVAENLLLLQVDFLRRALATPRP